MYIDALAYRIVTKAGDARSYCILSSIHAWVIKTVDIRTHLDVSEEALMLKKVALDWLAIHLPEDSKSLNP